VKSQTQRRKPKRYEYQC